jgi:hypothetical protein
MPQNLTLSMDARHAFDEMLQLAQAQSGKLFDPLTFTAQGGVVDSYDNQSNVPVFQVTFNGSDLRQINWDNMFTPGFPNLYFANKLCVSYLSIFRS